MPGLSCSTQGIFLSFFFVFFFFFSFGMQNLAHCLTEGLYQGSLHWECEVLATEPPGKSLSQVFLPGIWRPSLPLKGSTTELHPLSGTSSRRVAVRASSPCSVPGHFLCVHREQRDSRFSFYLALSAFVFLSREILDGLTLRAKCVSGVDLISCPYLTDLIQSNIPSVHT